MHALTPVSGSQKVQAKYFLKKRNLWKTCSTFHVGGCLLCAMGGSWYDVGCYVESYGFSAFSGGGGGIEERSGEGRQPHSIRGVKGEIPKTTLSLSLFLHRLLLVIITMMIPLKNRMEKIFKSDGYIRP